MGAKTPVLALLSFLWLGTTATPLQAIPITLLTDLSDRHLQTLEQLVAIAQQNASSVKEASAELGVASLGDDLGVDITSSYSKGSFIENREQFEGNGCDISASLTLNPLAIVTALQKRPTLNAKLKEAKRQKRVEVVQAYVAYLQAKQVTAIAQHRVKLYSAQTVADSDAMTAANELFTANDNERVVLENLAAVVGRSPVELLDFLK
jgi:hypothetical protein